MRKSLLLTGIIFLQFVSAQFVSAQDATFLQAVGFALTGSDDAKVKVIDLKNCVFAIGNDIYHLNNIHVERVVLQSWTRRLPYGEEKTITAELHGDSTVYETTTQGIEEKDDENENVKEMYRLMKKNDPNVLKPKHITSNERKLTLTTSDMERVKRAWAYIYTRGCTGKKSPF